VYRRLGNASVALLAIGGAVQTARWLARSRPGVRTWLPRFGWVPPVVIGAVAFGMIGGDWAAEQVQQRTLSPARPGAPNVLFIANQLYCSRESGLARGFLHDEDFRVSPAEMLLSFGLGRTVANSDHLRHALGAYDIVERKTAADINRDFLAWVRPAHEPFFAF